MRIVSLDCGTSGVRAAHFDCSGDKIKKTCEAQRPLRILRGPDGRVEQDPEEFYQAARSTLLAALRAGPCDRIVVGAQMHGLLRAGRDGRARSNFSLWSDSRAMAACRAMSAAEQREFRARSGCLVSPGLPYFRLLEARRAGVSERADELLLSHKSYFFLRACGWLCEDRALAAASGLYSLRDGEWDAGALAAAGIARTNLPTLVDCEAELGAAGRGPGGAGPGLISSPDRELCDAAGDAVWIAGGADGGLAHLGTAGPAPGAASLSIGTSSAARLALPAAPRSAAPHFCYPLSRELFLIGLASNNGGEALLAAGARLHADPAGAAAERLAVAPARRDLFVAPYVFAERDVGLSAPTPAGFYDGAGAPFDPGRLDAGEALAALGESLVFAAWRLMELGVSAAFERTPESIALSGSFALARGPASLVAALAEIPVFARRTGGPLEGALYFAGAAGRRALAAELAANEVVAPAEDALALREKYAQWKARYALRESQRPPSGSSIDSD